MAETRPAASGGIAPVWLVGVIGHRTLDAAAIAAPLERELAALARAVAHQGGELHVLVSAAAGTDLAAIRAARRLARPLHLLLPLEESEFLGDFGSDATARAEAQRALAEARANPQRDSVRVARTAGSRPACYFDTDAQIVESADVLLMVWDGVASEKLGGTAQLAALALALQKPILHLDPKTLAVRHENLDLARWPAADAHWQWLLTQGVVAPAAEGASADDATRAAEVKTRLSLLARRQAGMFRGSARTLIALSALSGLAGIAIAVIASRVSSAVVLTLQATQLVMLVWVLRTRWHLTRRTVLVQWTHARAAAEIWRGLAAALPFVDPFRPLVAETLPEWRRFAVGMGVLLLRSREREFAGAASPLEAFKAAYDRERLGPQCDYYARELAKTARWGNALPTWAKRCSFAAAVFVLLAMLNRAANLGWTASASGIVLVVVLPALLPLLAAFADGFATTFDLQRRHNRFRTTQAVLQKNRAELPHLKTADSVGHLVERTERLLLAEQAEWHAVTQKLKV